MKWGWQDQKVHKQEIIISTIIESVDSGNFVKFLSVKIRIYSKISI